jgi:hypothetical protein
MLRPQGQPQVKDLQKKMQQKKIRKIFAEEDDGWE